MNRENLRKYARVVCYGLYILMFVFIVLGASNEIFLIPAYLILLSYAVFVCVICGYGGISIIKQKLTKIKLAKTTVTPLIIREGVLQCPACNLRIRSEELDKSTVDTLRCP
ncbi:hypothetical protein E4H12_15155, partial [Candidatus Thorarchaeota archaeon]